jgi:RsiW-degrading membrane proteinase PrsW (M82 family)
MPILTQPAFGPKVALTYVTVGMLIDVWTLVWYFTRDFELSRTQQFWVVGLVLTGLTLILLGVLLGPLGRSARRAELPPPEATPAEAAIQQTAAANPPAVAAPPLPQPPPGTVIASPAARPS